MCNKEKNVNIGISTQGIAKGNDMNKTQCYSCKEYGHITNNSSKKFHNYGKQENIIKHCLTNLKNQRINTFQVGDK